MTPYYQDDACTIYHGDWREVEPDLRYDCIVADPPYGKMLDYGNGIPDTRNTMIGNCIDMVSIGKPLVFSIPQTRLFDVPQPQWIGVWYKPMSMGFWKTPFYPHWEPLCFYHLAEKLGHDDVWVFNTEKPNGHPCPKPLGLMLSLVGVMPGEVVLDPFMGSGTTLRAAKDLGRKAIGIEIEERYCEIAAKRLAQGVLL